MPQAPSSPLCLSTIRDSRHFHHIIATAKCHGLDPFAHLRDLLACISDHPSTGWKSSCQTSGIWLKPLSEFKPEVRSPHLHTSAGSAIAPTPVFTKRVRIPKPKILHPYPNDRFSAKHPR